MKVVPKFEIGSSIVQQSDNTPVKLLPRKVSDRILSGLEIILRLVPRLNTDYPKITEDNRTKFEKRRDKQEAYKTILTRTDGKVSSLEINLILDNVFYGTSVDFKNKPLGIVLTNKSNFTSNIISHELDHAIHIPSEFPKGFNRNAPDYLLSNNGSELAARGSLIKDYFKLTNPDLPITEDMLKYAALNYVKDTGIDNNMTEFFNNITDWKEAAKWLSKYATIVSLPILSSKEY